MQFQPEAGHAAHRNNPCAGAFKPQSPKRSKNAAYWKFVASYLEACFADIARAEAGEAQPNREAEQGAAAGAQHLGHLCARAQRAELGHGGQSEVQVDLEAHRPGRIHCCSNHCCAPCSILTPQQQDPPSRPQCIHGRYVPILLTLSLVFTVCTLCPSRATCSSRISINHPPGGCLCPRVPYRGCVPCR